MNDEMLDRFETADNNEIQARVSLIENDVEIPADSEQRTNESNKKSKQRSSSDEISVDSQIWIEQEVKPAKLRTLLSMPLPQSTKEDENLLEGLDDTGYDLLDEIDYISDISSNSGSQFSQLAFKKFQKQVNDEPTTPTKKPQDGQFCQPDLSLTRNQ